MTSHIITSMAQCALGDWIAIAVIAGTGAFSLIFLALGIAALAKYLLWSERDRRRGATA
jgi:hypothetical protein